MMSSTIFARFPVDSEFRYWFSTYKVTAGLQPKTIESYTTIIDRLKLHFGDTPLPKIRPKDVEWLYLRMKNPNSAREKEQSLNLSPLVDKPLSSSTCQRHHAVLHRAFKFAVRDGDLRANPLDKIDRPASSAEEVLAPEADDVNAQLEDLEDSPYYMAVLIAIMTGRRQSEVLGLKWDDIDYKTGKILIRRVRQRVSAKFLADNPPDGEKVRLVTVGGCRNIIEKDRTKSGRNTQMTMPASLIAVLKDEQKRQKANRLRFGDKYIVSDYVCVHEDGSLIDNSNLSRAVNRFRYHDLRHANANLLNGAGVALGTVSRRLGHSTPTTTARTYIHFQDSQDALAAKALDGIIKVRKKS